MVVLGAWHVSAHHRYLPKSKHLVTSGLLQNHFRRFPVCLLMFDKPECSKNTATAGRHVLMAHFVGEWFTM